MREYLLCLIAAAAVTYLMTPVVRKLAISWGVMATVRDRDVHDTPTPRLGGLAMFAGLLAGLLLASQLPRMRSVFEESREPLALLTGCTLIVILGVVDDKWGLDAPTKFAGQALAAAVMALQGIQIIWLPIGGTLVLDPLPSDAIAFKRRLEEGRGRLTLIANEVARLGGAILLEYAAAARKVKESKNAADACLDAQQQLQRLIPKQFLLATPWERLQHLARYCKAVTLRLEKYRADPARDAGRLAELRPLEQRYWRLVAERKGAVDERMAEFRWLLEELRVSFFAQELRTPQPVSVKRLEKAWTQLQ